MSLNWDCSIYDSEQYRQGVIEATKFISVPYTKYVPMWLGKFRSTLFGNYRSKQNIKIPQSLQPVYEIARETWNQHCSEPPTTVFFQVYETGDYVSPHIDPSDNLEITTITVFGDFDAPITNIEGIKPFQLLPGSTLVMPCFQYGKRGPRHSVEKITRGTRYAFILNRIKGEQNLCP